MSDPISEGSSGCSVCFNLSEAIAIYSGQAVHDGDYDELPHISWFGLEDKTYRIHGTFQLFKESAASGCRFCQFLGAVTDEFVPDQTLHKDTMIIYLEEACISIELRPANGDKSKIYVYVYRPADSISEQSTSPSPSASAYEHIPILPDIDLPNSERSFNYLKSCLKTCVETHKKCRQDMSSPPRRLLRIGSPGNNLISLYETPVNFQDPYVALSYCWGKSPTLKTESSNIKSLKQGFDLSQLPATIRDAIRITQNLGLEYIWIDALCIVQDSRTDWEEQSAKMCSIYEQAYLTIAASSSGAADISFADHTSRPQSFRYRVSDERESDKEPNTEIVLAARVECTSGHHYNPTGRVLAPPEPILTRGWTLQESILATRCIAYSTDELQWRCRETSECECEMPEDFRRDILVPGDDDDDDDKDGDGEEGGDADSFSLWNQVVEQYTQRHLTVSTDKLPALSGICQLIAGRRKPGSSPSSPPRYLAGLWEDRLPYCLLWERATDVEGSDVAVPDPGTRGYRAPSWSWASVDCPVYPSIDLLHIYESARVISSAVSLAGADPFGQVLPGASITVAGRLLCDVKVYEVEGRFATYRVQPLDRDRGSVRDEEIVADGPLEAFRFRDEEGRVRRSVRRSIATTTITTTTTTGDADAGQEGATERELEYGGGSTVFLFLTARRHYKPNDFTTFYFLVLGVSPKDCSKYERLGMIGMGFGHHEFDDVAEHIITIL